MKARFISSVFFAVCASVLFVLPVFSQGQKQATLTIPHQGVGVETDIKMISDLPECVRQSLEKIITAIGASNPKDDIIIAIQSPNGTIDIIMIFADDTFQKYITLGEGLLTQILSSKTILDLKAEAVSYNQCVKPVRQ